MIEHTKTPWRVFKPSYDAHTYGIDAQDGTAVVWFGMNQDNGIRKSGDAEFIVQSCNAHKKLVNALRRIANGEVSTITEAELATDTLREVGESTEPYLYPTKEAKL